MEKIKLNAIANAYHETRKQMSYDKAITLVETEVIPALEKAATCGNYTYLLEVKDTSIDPKTVCDEILKRVECDISGYRRNFIITW